MSDTINDTIKIPLSIAVYNAAIIINNAYIRGIKHV